MSFDEWWEQEWKGDDSAESERCRRVATCAFAAGGGPSAKYKIALELALILLHKYEPGDSRAVSDEFVAMAAILSDVNTADDCVDLVRKVIARETALEIQPTV